MYELLGRAGASATCSACERRKKAKHALEEAHDGPLAVLSLLKDGRARAVEDLVIDLVMVPRQAVHELPVGRGAGPLAELCERKDDRARSKTVAPQ